MSRTVIFLSYRAEIPWAARLGRQFREEGFASQLWIFGKEERALGLETRSFATVVDLMEGFDRQRIDEAAGVAARRAARQLEESLDETFLHREASIDRRITGFDHIEIPKADIPSRWTWDQLCALAVHLDVVVGGLLDAEAPEALMVEPVLLPERLACRLAARAGVPVLIPGFLPYLPDRLYFTDRLDARWPDCTDRYAEPGRFPSSAAAQEVAHATVATIRERSTMPQRREGVRDFLPTARLRFGPSRATNVWSHWAEARRDNTVGIPHAPYPELVAPTARLRRKIERFRLRRGFDRWAQRRIPSSAYALYCLHSQPEITVEGWAFEFQDQVALVRNIAATLPADMVLLVKEHRIQAGLRDPAFYEELLSIPGVVLLHDGVPTREVIRGARLVCTLTGTVALEAMCLGVPSVVFGDVYYEHFAGIRRVQSFSELAEVVADLDAFATASDEQVVRALAVRHDASHEAGWMSGGRFEADEALTVKAILSHLSVRRADAGARSRG